jgi:hypothetical protein
MIIVTSLSNGHANKLLQFNALESWRQFGKCYSLNCESEIELLKADGYSGIEFISTDRTLEYFTGKPLVSINAIIDFAKSLDEDLLIINSDIILAGMPELKQDGVTIFSRYNYTGKLDDCTMFDAGFDVFYIPKKFLRIFPPSIYGLGISHFDHAIPFHVISKNIPLYWPENKYAFHKTHVTQYDYKQWEYIGEYFRFEFKLPKQMTIGQIATMAMQKIKNHLIKY